ncbi:MAG: glycoside hydrolase domain-containing protein [Bryobacteraceae bacterium]
MHRIVTVAIAAPAFLLCILPQSHSQPPPSALPLPRMTVPATIHAPVIDGVMQPGEWDRAAACTGFVTAFEGKLAKVQSTAWLTYDSRYLYVAFRNLRGPQLSFISARARRTDDEAIVYDPSNEIWFSPPGTPQTTYQTLFNVYPAVLDTKLIPSVGYSSKSWSGKWEVASRQNADSWTVEARAPISAFGVDHIADGSAWRALFTTDVLGEPDKFRAWAPGGAFADIPRHGLIDFTNDGPAFQLLNVDSIFAGRPMIDAAVVGPVRSQATVRIEARFGASLAPGGRDLTVSRDVVAVPGSRQTVQLPADLLQAGLKSGFCEITAKTGATVLYHQVFPFLVDGSVRRPPANIATTPYRQPFGLTASYAPLSKKLVVKIDRYYMQARGAVGGGHVQLVAVRTGRTLAQGAIGEFSKDYSEFALDLKDVTVPVETERDWENLRLPGFAVTAPGKTAGAPPVDPAYYELRANLTDKSGNSIASASVPVNLQGYQFAWLPNEIGISNQTIAPWTPMRGQDGLISLWNKSYSMRGSGIADRIVNSGTPQLSAMTLEAVIDGRTTALSSQAPATAQISPAAIELTGQARAPNLTVDTKTRVEFDGFVWNSMTVQPTRANVGRLSLVVTMPASEGSFFVTTSGGWSSYFGETPDKWDSRESSLPSLTGNFVPYIFLTDSERGFSVFADNEKGWRLDPALPTQEIGRHNGVVTLRVNFIDRQGPIDRPLTIQYGWMVTPQKPQPASWRGYLIDNRKYFPQATPVFWNEADWDVSWPYYSSPFPHSYDKSRALLNGSASQGVVGCVGNIAHAIARYSDYKGRHFDALAADWGNTPGNNDNGDVARSRGPNDFDLFHFDRWSKLSGLGCIYFDENYISEDWNYLTGGAYLLPDGKVQPGYDFLGLREYNKRLRYMFHDNGKPAPNLWEHTTGGQAVYAWMPDVSMEGENVEPTDLTSDYIDMLPSSRLRSIGMGRNLGSAPFVMCQALRHGKGEVSKILVHQFVGWVLAHDVLPEGVTFWPPLAAELELWRDDVRFLPWWTKGTGIDSTVSGILASAHVRPGNAVLWIVNTNRDDKTAGIRIDARKIGLDPEREIQAYDAEDGKRYSVTDSVLTVPVPKRMWRAVRLSQPRLIGKGLAFFADFEHEVAATEAWGGRYPLGASLPEPVDGGKTGKGASIERPLAFAARHHVSGAQGTISLDVRLRDSADGTLVSLGGLELVVSQGTLVLRGAVPVATKGPGLPPITDRAWHSVTLAWLDREVWVSCDGAPALAARLNSPLQLPGMGHGLEIRDDRTLVEPAKVTFGPMHAIIDNLRMGTSSSPQPRETGFESERRLDTVSTRIPHHYQWYFEQLAPGSNP